MVIIFENSAFIRRWVGWWGRSGPVCRTGSWKLSSPSWKFSVEVVSQEGSIFCPSRLSDHSVFDLLFFFSWSYL